MLLVMDVGNTNIKTGLFEEGKLRSSWRLATDPKRTADEYGVCMESFFNHLHIDPRAVQGIIMSSVVPGLNYTLEHMCELYFFGQRPLVVNDRMNLGLRILYDFPDKLGADRICNTVAAYQTYGGPLTVVDFGTATTYSVVTAEGDFLGGLICPGLIVSSDALIENAAQLRKVEFQEPRRVIASNTEEGIRSGLFQSYVGQVDYIIGQIEKELGYAVKTIATGGMSGLIASGTKRINAVNPTLTLEGLARIYAMNRS